MPTIGYLHTGIEKTAEQKKWQQVIPLVERMDYLAAQSNSLAYALSVEKLLGLEMPQRVKDIRVLIAELQRMASHLIWLGTHAMEIGAVSMLFYAIRERELLLNINELIAGFRFFPSYFRVGGLREDLPRGFHEAVNAFLDRFPAKIDEFEGLLTKNDIFLRRTEGVGVLTQEDALAWGLVGPIARASRLRLRRPQVLPVSAATRPTTSTCRPRPRATCSRATACASQEMRESVKICRQAIERITPTGAWACDDPRVVPPPKDKVYTEMEALIQHFLIYSQGFTVPAGDAYVPVEGPRGEHGVLRRVRRDEPAVARQDAGAVVHGDPGAAEASIKGGLIADVVAVIGSNDVVMGDCDR